MIRFATRILLPGFSGKSFFFRTDHDLLTSRRVKNLFGFEIFVAEFLGAFAYFFD
jgi:hypothetical protein